MKHREKIYIYTSKKSTHRAVCKTCLNGFSCEENEVASQVLESAVSYCILYSMWIKHHNKKALSLCFLHSVLSVAKRRTQQFFCERRKIDSSSIFLITCRGGGGGQGIRICRGVPLPRLQQLFQINLSTGISWGA